MKLNGQELQDLGEWLINVNAPLELLDSLNDFEREPDRVLTDLAEWCGDERCTILLDGV